MRQKIKEVLIDGFFLNSSNVFLSENFPPLLSWRLHAYQEYITTGIIKIWCISVQSVPQEISQLVGKVCCLYHAQQKENMVEGNDKNARCNKVYRENEL